MFDPLGSSTVMNVYAVFLRPDFGDKNAVVDLAEGCQQRWGGLHSTLCSFAPKLASGEECAHGSSLIITTHNMLQAATPPALAEVSGNKELSGHGCVRWKLDANAELPETDPKGAWVSLRLPGSSSHVLTAMTRTAKQMQLYKARTPDSLHIALGQRSHFPPEQIEAMRVLLRNCNTWNLVIVKCIAGEKQLRVSEDREKLPLEWRWSSEAPVQETDSRCSIS
eukprot:TRINITY_DN38832_c0_g1_i1.p1 TRINITY_DN38832_c0_g1~~TRINITY_DN38832_c0_g1_i1.p1  ORF type:complete len:223 (+),score=37.18 TRINITY_DN38832_c0_g1_i1:57-725(+)